MIIHIYLGNNRLRLPVVSFSLFSDFWYFFMKKRRRISYTYLPDFHPTLWCIGEDFFLVFSFIIIMIVIMLYLYGV